MSKGMPKSGDWCDTESVMRTLNISARTVQKYAQLGWLPYKTMREGRRHYRLYNEADVAKLLASGLPRSRPNGEEDAAAPEERKQALPSKLPIRPHAALRRNFSITVPEGKVTVSLPADLSEKSRARALVLCGIATEELSDWREMRQTAAAPSPLVPLIAAQEVAAE